MPSAAARTRRSGSRSRFAAGPSALVGLGRLAAVVLLVAAAGATPALAAKTDVVVLRNGDTLTGEVRELSRGRLSFKTDDIGTIDIEWDKIGSVNADATFEVGDIDGRQFFGALRPGLRPGDVRVVSPLGDWALDLLRVVVIQRLGATFWQRLDGSIDAGISYTSSSELLKIDLAARVVMTRRSHETSLDAESTMTRQTDVEDTRRNSVALAYQRRFANRWFAVARAQAEQNRELGFDVRGALGAGGGRYLLQGRRHQLLSALGLSVNREKPLEGESATNLEAVLALTYDLFSYDFPKVDVYADLVGFASLTDWGRTRLELDVRVKRELLKDFTVSFRVYESYDNRPPTEGSSRNDYGASFGLGLTF
jgi:putative salt-induced outer membrane protein YdiY